jgi:hypothetical protein
MTRSFVSLVAGALLLAPLVVTGAQAQQSPPLNRDPADTRIQGGVQPLAPMGAPGNQPVGRAIGRIGGNDAWVDRGGETGRPQSPDRTPSGMGTSGLAPNQGAMSWSPNSSLGTMGGSTGGGAMGPARER